MYKLCFYVPDSHVEAVKQAVFAAGGGRVGAYDSCAWQVLGQGQFRPLTGSQPFLGSQGALEVVAQIPIASVASLKEGDQVSIEGPNGTVTAAVRASARRCWASRSWTTASRRRA